MGDPHYSTYDGLRYSYQGNCKYILTQTKDRVFRVITENIQCGTSGVTCAKNIFIKYHGLNIALMRGRDPVVNDVEIRDLTLGRRVFGDVALMKSGLFIFVNSSDFSIRWDEKTRIYVTVRNQLRNQMAGLCGDFDGDSSDDYKYEFSSCQYRKKNSSLFLFIVRLMVYQVLLQKWLNHGKLNKAV